jgi:hypothetical protein
MLALEMAGVEDAAAPAAAACEAIAVFSLKKGKQNVLFRFPLNIKKSGT